jgi:hypothetical protein
MAPVVNEVRTDVRYQCRFRVFLLSCSSSWALSGAWRVVLSVSCFGLLLNSLRCGLHAG